MNTPRQLHLFKKDLRFFGGLLLLGRRKSKRPFSTKESMHLVLRSSWARKQDSLLHSRNKKPIERILQMTARKYGISIYQKALVGNHLHLVIRAKTRKSYDTFIRVLSSQIASHVMKQQSFEVFRKAQLSLEGDPPALETEPQGKEQQFWQMRPFSRVLYWGLDFRRCCKYVCMNSLEASGFVQFKDRGRSPYTKSLTLILENRLSLLLGPNAESTA